MSTTNTPTLNGNVLASTRQNIASFLQRCGWKYTDVEIDEEYYSECCQAAISRGFPMDGKYSFRTHMEVGVAIASNCYGHLPDHAAKMWMCLFTAAALHIDTMAIRGEDMVHVYHFNERFVSCQPQGDPIMNAIDVLLREVTCLHSPLAASLITASILDFVSSNCLDNETKDMQISPRAPFYPEYSRVLSGMSNAYGLFVFPSTLPMREYIQCMPDLATFINHENDIISYYKEEIEGDTTNYLSLMAASRAIAKEDALHELIETTVQAHHNILECLRPYTEAYDAYVSFSKGSVKFYTAAKRYKVKEIMAEMPSS